jgi:iron complex outermembrane receptor protein
VREARPAAVGLVLALAVLPSPAPLRAQQRAEDNAVTAADDAFGTAIGLQTVGLYSQTDARGFNPQQAGNLRIDGMYFDQQTWISSPCVVRETAMRIGIAAQDYAFPSPTGIADLSLRTPGESPAFSGLLSRGPFNGSTLQLEQQLPLLGNTLSADICGAFFKNFLVDTMRRDATSTVGLTLRFRPAADTEIVPFWSYIAGGGHQILPLVYTDGTVPLRLFRERDLAAQTTTSQAWRQTTLGGVVKSQLADAWRLEAGLFHSQERDPQGDSPYLQLNADGTADSVADLAPRLSANSTSGEMRVSRSSSDEGHRRQLEFAVRGRASARTYGGDATVDFGNLSLLDQTQFPQPAGATTARSVDVTRELDVGATYEERWQGLGSAAIGLLRENYRRTAVEPGPAPPAEAFRSRPWLLNLRAAVDASPRLVFYGSYTQGLEDSALAPNSAVNRGEPPAAARSWQADGGLRWSAGDHLKLIFGAFDIHKPYLNLDLANVYRPLGRLRNEGLETSLSYSNDGLTLLGGGVLLRPHVDLTVPQPGVTGTVPIGPVPLTLTANLDYAPAAWGPWAASLQWNRLSERVATNDDRQQLPVLATIGAGVRYQWKRGQNSWTLRLDGFNLNDAQGLHVSALGLVLPEQGRRFALTLATDL